MKLVVGNYGVIGSQRRRILLQPTFIHFPSSYCLAPRGLRSQADDMKEEAASGAEGGSKDGAGSKTPDATTPSGGSPRSPPPQQVDSFSAPADLLHNTIVLRQLAR